MKTLAVVLMRLDNPRHDNSSTSFLRNESESSKLLGLSIVSSMTHFSFSRFAPLSCRRRSPSSTTCVTAWKKIERPGKSSKSTWSVSCSVKPPPPLWTKGSKSSALPRSAGCEEAEEEEEEEVGGEGKKKWKGRGRRGRRRRKILDDSLR